MTVVEYDIVTAADVQVLVNLVNEKGREGWQPQGGIALNAHGFIAQAIVRVEP